MKFTYVIMFQESNSTIQFKYIELNTQIDYQNICTSPLFSFIAEFSIRMLFYFLR